MSPHQRQVALILVLSPLGNGRPGLALGPPCPNFKAIKTQALHVSLTPHPKTGLIALRT